MIMRFLCTKFGRHNPGRIEGYDPKTCEFISHCKYCGKLMKLDSKGNWW